MLVRDAREAARTWVGAHATGLPGFRGAFLTGSVLAAAPGADLPRTSDVDVSVVLAQAGPGKPGKSRSGGVLLDVAVLPAADLADPREVAGCYFLAPSFATPGAVLADRGGFLEALSRFVSADFATPAATARRCADVAARVRRNLAARDPHDPWHRQVLAWLFPASLPTQIPLVADLRVPTVRRRYVAAREVLHARGLPELHGELLGLLGCAGCGTGDVAAHLEPLAEVFDTAAALGHGGLPFSRDLSPDARTVSVDGTAELVRSGSAREAVFWIVATLARCRTVLADGGAARDVAAADAALRRATTGLLGVRTPADLAARDAAVLRLLPVLLDAAASIAAQRGPGRDQSRV
ncbi:hypothetical protein NUM3379_06250 [Kineococcus sp. NUM-3379]